MSLGYARMGSGPKGIIVLNDWMSCTSSWLPTHPYLNQEQFTWVFADLRGYGRSKEQSGDYDLPEAAGDVLQLASSLGWDRFSIVGHSMSSLIALHLAQQHPHLLSRVVVVTPPPPVPPGPEAGVVDPLLALARGDDRARRSVVESAWGDRLSEGWIRFKLARWRESSSAEAAAKYVTMFARDGLPDPSTRIAVPVLAVTGECDAPPMRSEVVARFLSRLCDKLEVTPIHDSAHYPMQETPPLLVSILERFLLG